MNPKKQPTALKRLAATLLLPLLVISCTAGPEHALPAPLESIKTGFTLQQIYNLLPVHNSTVIRQKHYLAIYNIQERSWQNAGLKAAYFYFRPEQPESGCHALLLEYRQKKLPELQRWLTARSNQYCKIQIDTSFPGSVKLSIDLQK